MRRQDHVVGSLLRLRAGNPCYHTSLLSLTYTPLPSNLLAEQEGSNGAQGTPNIIDSSDESSQRRAGIAQHLLEAITGEDAAEETLVIWLSCQS